MHSGRCAALHMGLIAGARCTSQALCCQQLSTLPPCQHYSCAAVALCRAFAVMEAHGLLLAQPSLCGGERSAVLRQQRGSLLHYTTFVSIMVSARRAWGCRCMTCAHGLLLCALGCLHSAGALRPTLLPSKRLDCNPMGHCFPLSGGGDTAAAAFPALPHSWISPAPVGWADAILTGQLHSTECSAPLPCLLKCTPIPPSRPPCSAWTLWTMLWGPPSTMHTAVRGWAAACGTAPCGGTVCSSRLGKCVPARTPVRKQLA